MKLQIQIILLVSVALIASCGFSANQKEINSETLVEKQKGTLYTNEYGEIELIPVNDSLMQTIFRNNDGDEFDTILKIIYDYKLPAPDSLPMLKLHWGGVKFYSNRVQVFEFSSLAYINMFILIENIYTRPFYKVNEKVIISDEIKNPKGGQQIDGIYLADGSESANEFVILTGVVTKEKYPLEYYSTPDGPQGMFSDTTIAHYRLVVKNYTIAEVGKEIMIGRTMNIDGVAAFIWDNADSEAYYLYDHEPWTKKELDKKITIEGVLTQSVEGRSVIKAWQIIE